MAIVIVLFVAVLVHGIAVEVNVMFVLHSASLAFPHIDNRTGFITLQAMINFIVAVWSDIMGAARCPTE